ncbi:MAG: hypothetical protein K0S81_2306 [Rhodospirillales bacterium]|jgi:4-aminobutyrate aminotransferase-like enzyme|nr:hypothetical protein [Rhodospirillales bacterium]
MGKVFGAQGFNIPPDVITMVKGTNDAQMVAALTISGMSASAGFTGAQAPKRLRGSSYSAASMATRPPRSSSAAFCRRLAFTRSSRRFRTS